MGKGRGWVCVCVCVGGGGGSVGSISWERANVTDLSICVSGMC